ncbi:MAG: PTS mannose transporter subunit IID [Clostridiaceae bacterium]|nr:PTS mannose transporter subunit IID [Clostridiaceae bacterium]
MIAIILGTHGKFSVEILKSAEMIFGEQENVATITFLPGENPDDLTTKYEDAIKILSCEAGVLFMVDLFGGSPFNAASRIAVNSEKMDIVSGLNIPMLLEVFAARENSTIEDLTQVALSNGHLGIKALKETLKNSIEEEL